MTDKEKLAEAKRWMGTLPRDQFDKLLLLTNESRVDGAKDLLKPATNAGAMLGAVYDFVDQIDKLGGATSIAGVAKCHAMLTSLKSNRARAETLVMAPLREAIEAAKAP